MAITWPYLALQSKQAIHTNLNSPVVVWLFFAQDWIFDCLITFLKSPRWKTPVVSYIEEHCLIFDNEEENKLEYTTIHMVSIKQMIYDSNLISMEIYFRVYRSIVMVITDQCDILKLLTRFFLFWLMQNFFKMIDELLCELVAEMGITREQF